MNKQCKTCKWYGNYNKYCQWHDQPESPHSYCDDYEQDQEAASEHLSIIVGSDIDGDEQSQNNLKELWPKCSWQTIKERLSTEGSIWYVFWIDGVGQHFINTVL